MAQKIIKLYNMLLEEVPYFTSYLNLLGYSFGLLQKYKKNGWLDSPYKSVYIKPKGTISPLGIIYALQVQKNMKVHIGGISSLILKGISEQVYPITELKTYYVISLKRIFVPKWINKFCIDNNCKLRFIQQSIFKKDFYLVSFKYNKMNISISSTERAVFEMLSLIKTKNDYFDALKYFELLGELRADVVKHLLKECNSIKAKRLFLYLSEIYGKKYLEKIDKESINLGKGVRKIVNDGGKSVYIKNYNIEIPKGGYFNE